MVTHHSSKTFAHTLDRFTVIKDPADSHAAVKSHNAQQPTRTSLQQAKPPAPASHQRVSNAPQ